MQDSGEVTMGQSISLILTSVFDYPTQEKEIDYFKECDVNIAKLLIF